MFNESSEQVSSFNNITFISSQKCFEMNTTGQQRKQKDEQMDEFSITYALASA